MLEPLSCWWLIDPPTPQALRPVFAGPSRASRSHSETRRLGTVPVSRYLVASPFPPESLLASQERVARCARGTARYFHAWPDSISPSPSVVSPFSPPSLQAARC